MSVGSEKKRMQQLFLLCALVLACQADSSYETFKKGYTKNADTDKCAYDGIFYYDAYSIIVCANGLGYVQPCPGGTRNREQTKFRFGDKKSLTSFCDENLVGYRTGYIRPVVRPSFPSSLIGKHPATLHNQHKIYSPHESNYPTQEYGYKKDIPSYPSAGYNSYASQPKSYYPNIQEKVDAREYSSVLPTPSKPEPSDFEDVLKNTPLDKDEYGVGLKDGKNVQGLSDDKDVYGAQEKKIKGGYGYEKPEYGDGKYSHVEPNYGLGKAGAFGHKHSGIDSLSYDKGQVFGKADHDKGSGFGNKGFGYDDKGHAFGGKGLGYGDKGLGYGDKGLGYGEKGHEYSGKGLGYGEKGHEYGDKGHGYGDKGHAYSGKGLAYGGKGLGYGIPKPGYKGIGYDASKPAFAESKSPLYSGSVRHYSVSPQVPSLAGKNALNPENSHKRGFPDVIADNKNHYGPSHYNYGYPNSYGQHSNSHFPQVHHSKSDLSYPYYFPQATKLHGTKSDLNGNGYFNDYRY